MSASYKIALVEWRKYYWTELKHGSTHVKIIISLQKVYFWSCVYDNNKVKRITEDDKNQQKAKNDKNNKTKNKQ